MNFSILLYDTIWAFCCLLDSVHVTGHFFLGHFICQFHFRIVEGDLTKHLLQKEGVRLERVVSYLSGKLLLPASKFFQRPVHPEIQDWDCGVGKLDCRLLNAKAHHAVPTQGNLAHWGRLTGDVKSGPACLPETTRSGG